MKKLKYISILAMMALAIVACNDNDTTIDVRVERMHITNTEEGVVTLIEGDTWKPEMTVTPDNAIDKDEYSYRYTSGNDAIFTVDESGEVTAVGIGEAALTVWSVNNLDMWTSCVVKVEERIYPVTSIEIPSQYRDHYMTVESTFNLGDLITVTPDNASNPEVVYSSSDNMVAEVNEYGEVYTKALGDVTITVSATDGSGVKAECNIHIRDVDYSSLLDRTNWAVSLSHDYFVDAAVLGTPESLIDENLNTCLAMVKPGKSAGGITVGADEKAFFIIDMGTAENFDFFKLRHRTSNTTANLRLSKASVYGSNDGENFVEVLKNAPIATAASIAEVTVQLPENVSYRYFKLVFEGWSNSGNTIQIANFTIGNLKYLDLPTE